jgi:hypothetical protein
MCLACGPCCSSSSDWPDAEDDADLDRFPPALVEGEPVSQFKIKVARIETEASDRTDGQVRITFQIEHGSVSFRIPVCLNVAHYDDTEMVQAARSTLHRTFVELAAQTSSWKLSAEDLRQLSKMSARPKT